MIYGRFGDPVTIVRRGTLKDVEKLDGRKPDKQDREAIKSASYVVVLVLDDGRERLCHLAYLRADRGALEIGEALEKIDASVTCTKCGDAGGHTTAQHALADASRARTSKAR
jgi:hypothetical protein